MNRMTLGRGVIACTVSTGSGASWAPTVSIAPPTAVSMNTLLATRASAWKHFVTVHLTGRRTFAREAAAMTLDLVMPGRRSAATRGIAARLCLLTQTFETVLQTGLLEHYN